MQLPTMPAAMPAYLQSVFTEAHRAWWAENAEQPATEPLRHPADGRRLSYPTLGWMSWLMKGTGAAGLDVVAWPERLVMFDRDAPWHLTYLLAIVAVPPPSPLVGDLWAVFVAFDSGAFGAANALNLEFLSRTPPTRARFDAVAFSIPGA